MLKKFCQGTSSQREKMYGPITYFYVRRDIELDANDAIYRERKHQVTRIFLAIRKAYVARQEF